MKNAQTAKQEIWEHRLAEWHSSGVSQKKFCEQNGLAINTFHYWKRKINSPSHISAFIKIKASVKDNQRILIIHPAGIRLSVNRGVPGSTIAALIETLEAGA
jgi:hypothetical protein